jgi:hypothetical protein
MITVQDTSHYYHYNSICSVAQTYATAEISLTNIFFKFSLILQHMPTALPLTFEALSDIV